MNLIDTTLVHKTGPLPSGGQEKHPTIVLLHGRGSNEDDLLGLAPYLDGRLFLVAARAPLDFPYGGYTWYQMQDIGSPDWRTFTESYHELVTFLEDVKKGYPADPEQMYLFGFSMGSVMSLALGLTRPQDFRGVVAHSGYVPEGSGLAFQTEQLSRTVFFVAHGVEDQVIPVSHGRRASELLSELKATFTYREYPMGHQVSEESLGDIAEWLTRALDGGNNR